jgi:hypothetical protein
MSAVKDKIIILLVFTLLTVLTISCKQDPIGEYGEGLLDTMDRGKATVNVANMKNLENAVRIYRTQNGKYPESLEEVKDMMNTPVDLSLYDYDPSSGRVTLRY